MDYSPRYLYANIVPFAHGIARNYPADLRVIQKRIQSVLKTNLVPGYLPRQLPPLVRVQAGAGGAFGAGAAPGVGGGGGQEYYSDSDLHRVFGKGSFFYSAYHLVQRDSPLLSDHVKEILSSILSNPHAEQRPVAYTPVQDRRSVNVLQKVQKGFSEYQTRPQKVIFGEVPVLVQGSLVEYSEPNLRALVGARAAHRSEASKKSVIAAALRNMREYEMLNTLDAIFRELSRGQQVDGGFAFYSNSRIGRLISSLKQ
jgi:hypothetical protein